MEEKQQSNVFRKSSLEQISSPDALNDYIRVANPSVWAVLAAVLILLAAMLVWSALGTLPTTVKDACVSADGVLTGYLSDADGVAPGMEVRIGSRTGTVTAVSDTPYSYTEVQKRYADDYTLHLLGIEDWNYEVTISAPDVPDGMAEVTIVTGETRPITFLFN